LSISLFTPSSSTLFPYTTLFRSGQGERKGLRLLISDSAQALSLPQPAVVSAVCHLLWHQVIDTDLRNTLLFVNATPSAHIQVWLDRKSTRLNSSHQIISYAVFCL